MTNIEHDPDFPFVFRSSEGDKPNAKFRNRGDAESYASVYAHGSIVDTTPKVHPVHSLTDNTSLHRTGFYPTIKIGRTWYQVGSSGRLIEVSDLANLEDRYDRATLIVKSGVVIPKEKP